MKEIFSYPKLFTILLAIFYITALVGYYFNLVILFSILIFLFLSILIFYSNISYKKIIILVFIFFLGLIRAKQSLNLPVSLDEFYSNDACIYGQIVTSKNISNKNHKIKFFYRADSIEINEKHYNDIDTKFLVSIDDTKYNREKIVLGDYVKLKGKLRHPNKSSNPYQFDYQRYLLNNDTKNIMYCDSLELMKSLKFEGNLRDKWYYILKQFELTRNNILEKHSKNIKSPNLEVLGGIVFGDETINPDEEIKETFKNSGLLHLLAASGLNVALIYSIWWWIAGLIRFPYNLSILIGAFFVILYTFMTGFPPSILRASLMLLFVLIGKIIDRNASSVALIFFVGFLLLLISPKMLFDIGFQLSFVVTFGLLVTCPLILEKVKGTDKKYREKYKKAPRYVKYFMFLISPLNLASLIIVPLVAQIWVVPLQMHYFNTFTPFSVLANIAVIPFIGILSFIGFISSIIALVPNYMDIVVGLFDNIANPLLNLLIGISEYFSSFRYSTISTIGFSVFQIFTFWSLILLFIFNLKHNFSKKKDLIIFLTIFLVFLLSFINLDNYKNKLEIIMFDVGNADSFLIKTPKNKYIMIDTGKKSFRGLSDASMIMNKYMKNKGINTLEALIVTHFDLDHCSGVIDILKENKVKITILQMEEAKTKTAREIIDYVKNNKINYKIFSNNDLIYSEDDLKIKTIKPEYKSKEFDENENSIITLLEYKNRNMLFSADSGVLGYKTYKKYINSRIDVLKIGHHGALNSINQAMIDEMKPKLALISAGMGKFNHPHYSTISLLNKNNTNYALTKDYGFVKVIVDAKGMKTYYFDRDEKKIKVLKFEKINEIPFNETKYFKTLIKKEL